METKKRVAWNKGLKTGLVPKSAFKKGHIPYSLGTKGLKKSTNGSFKNGFTPWNKDKKGVQVGWNKGTKGIMKPNKTSFKKGDIPINKGKKRPEMIGDKNPSWKGGVTPESHKIRNSIEYSLFRKSCFERDNFTCQKTRVSGGDLIVHHINNFKDFPELRFAIDNGITLSRQSHNEFHKKYGFKNNTREQLEEFLSNK
jgi:hypothetical protein